MDKNNKEILQQIRAVRHKLIYNQVFIGYSGWARIGGALAALIGGLLMSSSSYPQEIDYHIFGWGSVCSISFFLNLLAVFWWQHKAETKLSNFEKLLPTIDVIAPLYVGAIATYTLIQYQMQDMLFGFWMCLFGLVHTASRHTNTMSIYYLGWYYLVCGTYCLMINPLPSFLNPMPMAIVFFIGEVIGGYLFIKNRSDKNNE